MVVRVQGRSTSSQTANLTLKNNFKNNGDIFLDSLLPGGSVSLNTSAAAMLTNVGRILVINNPGGSNNISGNVKNQGQVLVQGPLTIGSQDLGVFTNLGSFTVDAGATVVIYSGGNTYNQAAGKTLLSVPSSTLAVYNNSNFNLQGGTLAGLGTFNGRLTNTLIAALTGISETSWL